MEDQAKRFGQVICKRFGARNVQPNFPLFPTFPVECNALDNVELLSDYDNMGFFQYLSASSKGICSYRRNNSRSQPARPMDVPVAVSVEELKLDHWPLEIVDIGKTLPHKVCQLTVSDKKRKMHVLGKVRNTTIQDCNDIQDPAYRQAIVSGLLSSITMRGAAPGFALLYGTYKQGRQQIVIEENLLPLGSFLAGQKSVREWFMMSLLGQLCFNLALAQNVFGLLHHSLDLNHVGLVRTKQKHIIVRWNGDYLAFPTGGYKLKIRSGCRSSVLLNNCRIGDSESYTWDLVMFASQAYKAVCGLLPKDSQVLKLLSKWANCNKKNCSGDSCGVNFAHEFEQCKGERCDLMLQAENLDHFVCSDAFPSTQKPNFDKLFASGSLPTSYVLEENIEKLKQYN